MMAFLGGFCHGTTDGFRNWLKDLQNGGIVPPDTTRIVVDIDVDCLAQVYYEVHADERMFQRNPVEFLNQEAEALSLPGMLRLRRARRMRRVCLFVFAVMAASWLWHFVLCRLAEVG